MAPKVVPKTTFLEIGETLIFGDSTMIFMVFGGPEGSLEHPKTKKKPCEITARRKDGHGRRKCRKNALKVTTRAPTERKESALGTATGTRGLHPWIPTGNPNVAPTSTRRRPDAIARYMVFNIFGEKPKFHVDVVLFSRKLISWPP